MTDAFESASGNFLQSSQYFKQASEEFAKLEAIKNGLEQMGARLEDKITEINPKIAEGELEGVTKEEIEEYEKVAEEDLMGTEVPFIVEYAELTFTKLPNLMPAASYNYRPFKNLKKLDELSPANFESITPSVKTKDATLNWVRNSFVTTLTHYAEDKKKDPSRLNKQERIDYNWRQYIAMVMESRLKMVKTFWLCWALLRPIS